MAGLPFVIQQSNTVTCVKDENNFLVLFKALGRDQANLQTTDEIDGHTNTMSSLIVNAIKGSKRLNFCE